MSAVPIISFRLKVKPSLFLKRGSIFAARTILGLDSADATSKLLLCGSRGVGCIAVAKEGVTMVELLDLEEDEESEEDDEFDDAE